MLQNVEAAAHDAAHLESPFIAADDAQLALAGIDRQIKNPGCGLPIASGSKTYANRSTCRRKRRHDRCAPRRVWAGPRTSQRRQRINERLTQWQVAAGLELHAPFPFRAARKPAERLAASSPPRALIQRTCRTWLPTICLPARPPVIRQMRRSGRTDSRPAALAAKPESRPPRTSLSRSNRCFPTGKRTSIVPVAPGNSKRSVRSAPHCCRNSRRY